MDVGLSLPSPKRIGSRAETVAGRTPGDAKKRLQGKTRQVEAALRDVSREAEGLAAAAARVIRERGGEDFLRMTIEQRPWTTAAVALGVGFLIGRFALRDCR